MMSSKFLYLFSTLFIVSSIYVAKLGLGVESLNQFNATIRDGKQSSTKNGIFLGPNYYRQKEINDSIAEAQSSSSSSYYHSSGGSSRSYSGGSSSSGGK